MKQLIIMMLFSIKVYGQSPHILIKKEGEKIIKEIEKDEKLISITAANKFFVSKFNKTISNVDYVNWGSVAGIGFDEKIKGNFNLVFNEKKDVLFSLGFFGSVSNDFIYINPSMPGYYNYGGTLAMHKMFGYSSIYYNNENKKEMKEKVIEGLNQELYNYIENNYARKNLEKRRDSLSYLLDSIERRLSKIFDSEIFNLEKEIDSLKKYKVKYNKELNEINSRLDKKYIEGNIKGEDLKLKIRENFKKIRDSIETELSQSMIAYYKIKWYSINFTIGRNMYNLLDSTKLQNEENPINVFGYTKWSINGNINLFKVINKFSYYLNGSFSVYNSNGLDEAKLENFVKEINKNNNYKSFDEFRAFDTTDKSKLLENHINFVPQINGIVYFNSQKRVGLEGGLKVEIREKEFPNWTLRVGGVFGFADNNAENKSNFGVFLLIQPNLLIESKQKSYFHLGIRTSIPLSDFMTKISGK